MTASTKTTYTVGTLLERLTAKYFRYVVTSPEQQYTYYGGQPEEGEYVCLSCSVIFSDEHHDVCEFKVAVEAIYDFIEGLR